MGNKYPKFTKLNLQLVLCEEIFLLLTLSIYMHVHHYTHVRSLICPRMLAHKCKQCIYNDLHMMLYISF